MYDFKGSTIWARQTIDSDIFTNKPAEWFKIWFYIINRVNFKETKNYKRGQCFLTYQEIISYTNTTRNQVDGFIRWAKRTTMITTQKTTRGMIITVLNYAKYQDAIKRKNDTENDNKTDLKPKQNRNRTDTIVEECNNKDKNEKNISEQSSPIKYTIEDKKLAELLLALIKQNTPTFKKPNTDSWAVEIRKMREIDLRTHEQIEFLIRWCQKDNFWQANILSTAKLRKQFDTLVAQIKRNSNNQFNSHPKGITI